MAKEDKKKLSWSDVDETTIKGEVLKALTAMKEARKAARDKADLFEEAFREEARKKKLIPPGKTLKFSYNFGRIGVALDDDVAKADKAGPFKL